MTIYRQGQAALVPKPRVNLIRFHGVFAPNSKHRAAVTPAKRGKGNKARTADEGQDQTPAERRASMSWAQRLKRVFNIDIETCRECGGTVKVIACIEDSAVIEKILAHLQGKDTSVPTSLRPASRAPPADLFGCHHQTLHPIPMAMTHGSARIPVGLMRGVAAQVVRARANGWIVSAE